MANSTEIKDYISLAGLEEISRFVVKYVGDEVASSYKSARYDSDTKTVKLFTDILPEETATPAFSFVIPDPDLTNFLVKISGGTIGNVVVLGENGTVADSNVKLTDIATKEDVNKAIAGNFEKEIKTDAEIQALILDPSTAKSNVYYLVKDESVTGIDQYKEYTLVNVEKTVHDEETDTDTVVKTPELVCIGDTSVSLAHLATKDELTAATTRITSLEEKVGAGFVEVTTEQIETMWNAVINPTTPEEGGGGENTGSEGDTPSV